MPHAQDMAQILHTSLIQKFIGHFLQGTDVADIFQDDRHQHDFCFICPEIPGILLQNAAKSFSYIFFSLLRSGLVMVKLLCERLFLNFTMNAP